MATSQQPPKPAPKPGRVKVYRALYDYSARSDQEMSFSEGDLLYVSDQGPNNHWLPAICGGKKGLVPVNHDIKKLSLDCYLVTSENMEELPNPLHEAARRGNFQFLTDCINNQVSVNSLDKSGSTALYWACHGGHIEIVKYLLKISNTAVSSQNKVGDTPLHAASWKGHKQCVEILLTKGANVWTKNGDQKRPIDMAKDADIGALISRAMCKDTCNDECENEYESGSDIENNHA
uniref:Osteoclast-stimulating factor 1 n=1 Tax=Heterorhabditis bacteriophora TaxID=37862 RepID=A0A1I7WFZ1_HETBA